MLCVQVHGSDTRAQATAMQGVSTKMLYVQVHGSDTTAQATAMQGVGGN